MLDVVGDGFRPEEPDPAGVLEDPLEVLLGLDGRLRSGVPGVRPRLRYVSALMVDSAPASLASAHACATSRS